jgi:hypothetical protein
MGRLAGVVHALEMAFDAVSRRDCALANVRTYLPPLPLWLRDDVPPVEAETPEPDAAERGRLDELVSPWRAKYPGCRWRRCCRMTAPRRTVM